MPILETNELDEEICLLVEINRHMMDYSHYEIFNKSSEHPIIMVDGSPYCSICKAYIREYSEPSSFNDSDWEREIVIPNIEPLFSVAGLEYEKLFNLLYDEVKLGKPHCGFIYSFLTAFKLNGKNIFFSLEKERVNINIVVSYYKYMTWLDSISSNPVLTWELKVKFWLCFLTDKKWNYEL